MPILVKENAWDSKVIGVVGTRNFLAHYPELKTKYQTWIKHLRVRHHGNPLVGVKDGLKFYAVPSKYGYRITGYLCDESYCGRGRIHYHSFDEYVREPRGYPPYAPCDR